jgi:hypothetical protein
MDTEMSASLVLRDRGQRAIWTTLKISYGFILMLGEPWCPSLFMRIIIINKTLVSWHLKTSEVLLGAELIENASLNLTSFW